MENPTDNKAIVKQAQSILKDLGHDLSTGHVYELLSRLSGHNSHNVAKAKGVDFSATVEKLMPARAIEADFTDVSPANETVFSVKVKMYLDEAEMVKFYKITARDEQHARDIVEDYLNYRHTGDEAEIKLLETRILMTIESEEDYNTKNWEIVYPFREKARVEYAHPIVLTLRVKKDRPSFPR